MKKIIVVVVAVLFLGGIGNHHAFALEVVKKDNLSLNMDGRLQSFGLVERVNDPVKDHNRFYLFIKQARLNMNGKIDNWKYNFELAFAGEEEVLAPNPGVSLNLLDFSFDIPIVEDRLFFKVGQFNVPYSRERMANDGTLQFDDRSIQNLAFRIGRDTGGVIHFYPGKFAVAAGIFTGGGRDVPQRFLPESLGTPMFVFRAGFNNGYDEDIFTIKQERWSAIDKTAAAFFVNGMYMNDSLVGHSSVLNIKTSEKSLLLNSNWNPFIAQAPLQRGNFWQVGGDAAIRKPIGNFLASSEAEINYGRYSNSFGRLDLVGGRAQFGLSKKPFAVGLRYAFILPDSGFTNSNTRVTGGTVFH